ncbi:GNAT family N-acetyltransferase [Streptomyces cyaneus]|uniref:GNAT family N-acetyltransferase n=1 Tax=Streptomyces cyaneus TaxID=1904 RepID=UPI0013E321DF|nr:GNAT family N-acetyltransferase [Streptomyces cyaneus]
MKDDQVARVHERLAARPELCPVAFGEGRRFGLWDLASLTEGALGECVDPVSLTVSSEKRWRVRLGSDGREHRRDGDFRRRYWIRSPGSRNGSGPVGTIAVDTWPVGVGAVRVTSLYVHPVARRQGVASAALDMVYDACRAEGLRGFRLDTHWTWQPTVRYYLGRRLWVTSWKHALGFAQLSDLPAYAVREGEGGEVTFLVACADGESIPLLVAGNDGGRLRLRETEQYRRMRDERDAVRVYARATLALHLAVRGRPLVRGEEEWTKAHWSCDIGEPEGLAYKIGVFERVARDSGWRVESPYTVMSMRQDGV